MGVLIDRPTVHVNDVGTSFQITFVDVDGTAVDVSLATVKEIWFLRGDETTVKKDASYVTNGVDGKVEYVAETGFINSSGNWKMQGYFEIGTSVWHSSVSTFMVKENLSI